MMFTGQLPVPDKSDDEVTLIRKAARLADLGIETARPLWLHGGATRKVIEPDDLIIVNIGPVY